MTSGRTTQIPDYMFQYNGLPIPVREYRFLPDRKFRIDFYWPEAKLAVEIEGGIWMPKGGHTTGIGFSKNLEKYNLMAENGITLLRYVPKLIDFMQIKRIFDYLKKGTG